MSYSFSNNCIKNYWNQTHTVFVEGWVVYFFAIQRILNRICLSVSVHCSLCTASLERLSTKFGVWHRYIPCRWSL